MSEHAHTITRTWVTAAFRCVKCGGFWEQPYYTVDETCVCPHCNHAAPAEKRNEPQ